ncbi:RNA polymerase sigma24 factor [Paractinoplanes deccanensis]|uniref:RNA polymerase sigma24 factor n=1 Tax=Paractinoplanes deccanensis TaxID=113561 RepID=A0ABQ3YBH3_9ACTN|nr:RNA polymerase sigma-70 factor [Actinoplanes deccanensis]GID77145.1 RNA polymerase sigma24 factor [Actinoplanes deccanensis]
MTTDLDDATAVFLGVRPRLFGIAYRMLGSAGEAEDLLQDVWLRWQAYDRSQVTNPAAFLATTTTRLAINELQSARARRETYVGPWLPEPVDTSADPYLGAERGEALEYATLLLMERLKPAERAAYVLREAFDYPYAQIAGILQTSEPAVRQLVSRARKHLTESRRTPVAADEQKRLLAAFLEASRGGDLSALEKLLAPGVVSLSDGNGAPGVARRPVEGALRVAKFMMALSEWIWDGAELRWLASNGQSALLIRLADGRTAYLTAGATAEGIDRVLWQMVPEKLSQTLG